MSALLEKLVSKQTPLHFLINHHLPCFTFLRPMSRYYCLKYYPSLTSSDLDVEDEPLCTVPLAALEAGEVAGDRHELVPELGVVLGVTHRPEGWEVGVHVLGFRKYNLELLTSCFTFVMRNVQF